jgi:Sec-independent protein secretion pathway component TatC
MTLMIFAAPMIGLYTLSIAIAFIVGPKRLKNTDLTTDA